MKFHSCHPYIEPREISLLPSLHRASTDALISKQKICMQKANLHCQCTNLSFIRRFHCICILELVILRNNEIALQCKHLEQHWSNALSLSVFQATGPLGVYITTCVGEGWVPLPVFYRLNDNVLRDSASFSFSMLH